VDLDKLKELGFTVDEKLTLTETEILDAVIEMENNDFDEEVDGEDLRQKSST
jgi:hypothetical protein